MDLDPRLHFVAVTCIIEKDGRFLIMKRAANEKAFPDKWTVPGGKFVRTEYEKLPSTSTSHPQWYNMVEWVARKEVREEAGLEIEKPEYVTDLVFIRPDGYPVVTLSFWAKYKSGEGETQSGYAGFRMGDCRRSKIVRHDRWDSGRDRRGSEAFVGEIK